MRVFRLTNSLQTYSWGSIDGLERLLGIPNPRREPHAEFWIGAHPKAPSIAQTPEGEVRLDDLLQAEAESILGSRAVASFGRALPFLLKVLSAAKPLSIQAHPSKRKAEKGYERENLAGIPLDADERNYRDRNHKPEMVVALSPFEGLFGFRPIPEIIENIKLLAPFNAKKYIGKLERNPGRLELSVLFYSLISSNAAARSEILAKSTEILPLVLARRDLPPQTRIGFEWMERLRAVYPDDMGIFAPLILNCVTLQPGQGLFVGAGVLHAYLKGEALELMANSDNVIRGALTSKHVDVPELISVLNFDSERPEPFRATPIGPGMAAFPDFVQDFSLRALSPTGLAEGLKVQVSGPELLLCTEGEVKIEAEGGALLLKPGEAALACADAGSYRLTGGGLVYRACLPS